MNRLTLKAALQRPRWHGRLATLLGLLSLLSLLLVQPAQAHLMVAQRGTLNFVGTGGFVVMALPVDAFSGVDDDGDGLMSLAEMQAHGKDIEAQVQKGLQLSGPTGPLPLQAVMLNLSPDDATPHAPARHVVVLGRFSVANAQGQALDPSTLTLRLTLFGKTASAQQQALVATQAGLTQKMVLEPGREERALFPSAATTLLDHAALGAEHVLGGWDHLLFLLVVLSTGLGWRPVALALSCFTAGHAITLAASAWGGLMVPSSIVEPAIAATIIGMALYDRWSRTRSQPLSSAWRLALVFGCALVHGLGLAGALTLEGLDTSSRLLSLAGFNLGIEAAQLGVALGAGALLATWRVALGARSGARKQRLEYFKP